MSPCNYFWKMSLSCKIIIMNEVKFILSQKQIKRYQVITNVINGIYSIQDACDCLGLGERQIKRLKKGVKQHGVEFLIHKNTGRKPSNATPDEIACKIIELKNSELYKDANFLHFKELLSEHENINISYTPMYEILSNAGIISPKKRRKVKKHHRRKRKPQEGMLIQLDATPFEWFGTNEKFSLHGAIDDATGKVVSLYLSKNECLNSYFQVVRQMLLSYGIPLSMYADRHAIFLSQCASRLTIEEQLQGKVINDTQFGRAMKELGITLIPARSAQAKGRVERLWGTLQSRLPVEFKIRNISSIEEANKFLQKYILKFNSQFAVEPDNPKSAFRTIGDINIDNILCIKVSRIIDNGGVYSFYNKHFQIPNSDLLPKSKILVLVSPIFGVRAQYKNTIYDVIPFIKPKKKSKEVSESKSTAHTPPITHYLKRGKDLFPKLSFEYTDLEILQMLERIFHTDPIEKILSIS